jgi:hypothetical protein
LCGKTFVWGNELPSVWKLNFLCGGKKYRLCGNSNVCVEKRLSGQTCALTFNSNICAGNSVCSYGKSALPSSRDAWKSPPSRKTQARPSPSFPRQALRGGIQKSIFKHISGNRGTSRPKVDKSAQMAPRTHLRYPHEGPSVVSCPLCARKWPANGQGGNLVHCRYRAKKEQLARFQGLVQKAKARICP